MIKELYKSYKNDNRGSAIITGLVVSAVLIVLCLSLLLVAYSLFISTSKSTSDMSNREMLYSAAEALEHEITDVTVLPIKSTGENSEISYKLIADKSIITEGTSSTSGDPTTYQNLESHEFWKYIYENIWQGFDNNKYDNTDPAKKDYIKTEEMNGFTFYKQDSTDGSGNAIWQYYDPKAANDAYCLSNSAHADIEKCSKYFNISSIGSVKVVVQFYWELPSGFDGYIYSKAGTVLNAVYMLYNNKGEMLVRTERKYILNATNNDATIVSSTGIIPEFSLNGDWNGGYNGIIKITNNSEKLYESWMMIINTDDELSGFYNSDLVRKIDDSNYVVKYASHNQDIAPGASITFGFGSTTTYSDKPVMTIIVPSYQEVDREKYQVNCSSTHTWEENSIKYTDYSFEIVNKSDNIISDWRLIFSLESGQEIYNKWNFDIIKQEGNQYTIRNNNNQNSDIPVGNKITDLGFQTKGGSGTLVLKNEDFTLAQMVYDPSQPADPNLSAGIDVDYAGNWKWNRVGEEIITTGGDGE